MGQLRILVLGATGFVGSNITENLLSAANKVARVLRSKRDKDSRFVDFIGDITEKESLERIFAEFKPEVVINLVGIIKEKPPKITFENIVVEGTKNIIAASKDNNVKKIIYISAIGADINGVTKYFRTKAIAENLIQESGLEYTIFRPSLIFGPKAGFTNQFIELLKIFPFAPIIGSGKYLFQPVAIKILAECIKQATESTKLSNRIYDVCGVNHLTLKDIINVLKMDLGIKRFNLHLPMLWMKFLGRLGDLGLPVPVTLDQMKMLELGSTGDIENLRKDFKFKEIDFRPNSDYPLY